MRRVILALVAVVEYQSGQEDALDKCFVLFEDGR
jgi:hypothetical protein